MSPKALTLTCVSCGASGTFAYAPGVSGPEAATVAGWWQLGDGRRGRCGRCEGGGRPAAPAPSASRTCVALFSPRRGVFSPDVLCGRRAHYHVGSDDLCMPCARRRVKATGQQLGERDPWGLRQG